MYYFRLDDASDKRDVEKWERIEKIFDKYNIKPLVGVIPENKDESMEKYPRDNDFWSLVKAWKSKGWVIALHGCYHVCTSKDGGINPVNNRSEFAGESLEVQKERISYGLKVFENKGIKPEVFFAPSHTFDKNTILALKECSSIRVISDTVANKPYLKYGITFLPQQSGEVRSLPFKFTTFCYHPNIMEDKDFEKLEKFIVENRKEIKDYEVISTKRKPSIYDWFLKKLYFIKRGVKR